MLCMFIFYDSIYILLVTSILFYVVFYTINCYIIHSLYTLYRNTFENELRFILFYTFNRWIYNEIL